MGALPRSHIPVMRPLLPTGEQILPYLQRIDANRWYSNFGPLTGELERRLATLWGAGAGSVLAVSNATSGLTATLLAMEVAGGSLCLMPSWTFAASAHAVVAAGLRPFLVDVDAAGALTPAIAEAALSHAPAPVGAVMVVCPFGAPVDWAEWQAFRQRTGIAVVIDGAAAFDSVRPGPLPVVVSLHATKVLGCGEGGAVLCEDRDLLKRILRRTNFGFLGNRAAQVPAANAKMSEYHAAVALAAVDAWPERRRQWLSVLQRLRAMLAVANGVCWSDGLGRDFVASTVTVAVPGRGEAVAAALAELGIETRQWWGGGIHSHPAFAGVARLALPMTDRLAQCSLGLPCWLGLSDPQMERIGAGLRQALASA